MIQTTDHQTRARSQSSRSTRVYLVRAVVVLGALAMTASADARAPQNPMTQAAAKVRHWLQTGQASWYGRAVQGHRTASGERFDMNGLTCAHRTLPLGSWLRVTNLTNRKSVLVRVTDRGPVATSRIVDLSFAAAHAVGLDGIGRVQLEALNPSDPAVAELLAAKVTDAMTSPWMPRLR